MKVGAIYYSWYGKNNYHWREGYINTPKLGNYNSANKKVIKQHIKWARNKGINYFVLSWWGKNNKNEYKIKKVAEVLEKHNFKYFILYESVHLLGGLYKGFIKLDDKNIESATNDFKYLEKEYFNNPNYLKINNSPALYFYLTRCFTGKINELFCTAKNVSPKKIYIIGDQIYWRSNKPFTKLELKQIKHLNALTMYNPHCAIHNYNNLPKFINNVDKLYGAYKNLGKDIIPTVIPGFNDTTVRPKANHPIIPRRYIQQGTQKTLLNELTNKLEKRSTNNHILITSWNEWHEDTQIEPSIN